MWYTVVSGRDRRAALRERKRERRERWHVRVHSATGRDFLNRLCRPRRVMCAGGERKCAMWRNVEVCHRGVRSVARSV